MCFTLFSNYASNPRRRGPKGAAAAGGWGYGVMCGVNTCVLSVCMCIVYTFVFVYVCVYVYVHVCAAYHTRRLDKLMTAHKGIQQLQNSEEELISTDLLATERRQRERKKETKRQS